MAIFKQQCPCCESGRISRVRILMADALNIKLKCDSCANFVLHPIWIRKSFLLYLIFGAVVAYALSCNPILHYCKPASFFSWASLVWIIGCFILVSIPLTSAIKIEAPLGRTSRRILWGLWLSLFTSVVLLKIFGVILGHQVEFDFFKVHISWGNLAYYFLIVMWVTWDSVVKEYRRLNV